MKYLAIAILAAALLPGCGTIGSVGVQASYRDEHADGTAQEYSGGVNVGLKDAKKVKPVKRTGLWPNRNYARL